jgi:hypothetical protein
VCGELEMGNNYKMDSTTNHSPEVDFEVECRNNTDNQIHGLLGMMQTHYSPQIKTLHSCTELENSFLCKGQEKETVLEFDY